MNTANLKAKSSRLLLLLIIGIVGCQTSTPEPKRASQEHRSDTQLVLNNAVLEQSNDRENTVWKIKAESIVYSEDKQSASLNKVVGNLLQDGKIILQLSAKTGEVRDNGNVILLNKEIIASDPRNGGAIYTDAVEWRPQENLLLIKEKFNAIHPNLEITANRGKYFTDTESLEIQEDVVATTNKPTLRLNSDRLIWKISQEQIESPGVVEIVRYNDRTVTDKLVSDRAVVDLASHTATLNQNIELTSLDPQLQVATNFLTWNYQDRIGKTNQPIQILDRDRQISLTGNRGEIDLQRQLASLQDGVQGINRLKASELYARQLNWKIDTEEVEAIGDVVYEQADPQARLTGEKAVGTLRDNNIVVTSNGKQQVTTVIDN